MRRSQYRFHAIAISIISLVIITLFFIMRPAHVGPNGEQQLLGDRYIQIYSATWGEECNQYIDAATATAPVKKDDNGVLVESKPAQRVAQNNVLDTVSALCNGQLSCTFRAISEVMKTEPLASCFKTLKVSYRCYAVDRLWNISVRQGSTLTIDCHENAIQPQQ